MKLWLRKSLIVIVSILTFGVVTPSHALWSGEEELPNTQEQGRASEENTQNAIVETHTNVQVDTRTNTQRFIDTMTVEAEKQAMLKFGPKISNVIEDEFREIIMPNIESAIEMTVAQFPEEKLANLIITENPSGGVSEKIFNIYQAETGQDIIRFHVRRDKPPLEGYTFNFHYHTYHDQFQAHYTLGTIFWDKNTPPKWQTV